jgi:8-oxo-dGTP pyrophosphatase MutT (NUDIX family)
VLVVHRPRYDDWSLPKGTADGAETDEATALREVEEETGLRCVLGAELPSTAYTDSRGRPKIVRYWLMTVAADAGWEPDDEVDDLEWVPIAEATDWLTYRHDDAVVNAARTALSDA